MRTVLLIISSFIHLYSFAGEEEMFFITDNGKNGFFSVRVGPIVDNSFDLRLKVRWVDDRLKDIVDDYSYLILRREDLDLPMSDFIVLENDPFQQGSYARIRDSLTMNISLKENFTGGTLNFKFPVQYVYGSNASLDSSNWRQLTQTYPYDYTTTLVVNSADIKDVTPPELVILIPVVGEEKPVFEENRLSITVEAKDLVGIQNVKINNVVALHVKENIYTASVTLRTGDNMLVIRATDKSGNTTREELVVESTYYQPFEMDEGIYYALIIGVEEYDDERLQDLDQPIGDGQKFYEVLTTQYSFEPENVVFLKNPTRTEIIVTMDEMSQYVTTQDNLLIFYAGHGHYDEKKNLGYWLPSDAVFTNTANWIRNSTIRDYIMSIQSKHTLLIADACFSGSIFKSRSLDDAPKAIDRLYKYKSRKAMTSGTLTEVPDQSVFIQYLHKRLVENDQKFLASEFLFRSFKEAVLYNSNTNPQYGTIQGAGDEGGDFIFVKR
ncbi:MAG TPA: caspase family protein [Bacteroides sp.]|nr:caspase family protein [Bacteroides sp.]